MTSNIQEILKEIKRDKKFSPEHLRYFIDEFDERFWRALRNVLQKGVKKYVFKPSNRIVWIVVGNKRDYLIISDLYCSCDDFYVKVVIKKTARMCYHLLSKILADHLEYFEEFTVEDERHDKLMTEWKAF